MINHKQFDVDKPRVKFVHEGCGQRFVERNEHWGRHYQPCLA